MGKPQITVRISPSLLNSLNQYVESTGTSKTDVVISAIAQYLDCSDSKPVNQRLAELEKRMSAVEAKVTVEAK